MEINLSKGKINKTGESIRQSLLKKENISNEDLSYLQLYRTSFREPLKIANEELNRIMKIINKSDVITYRVKRIKANFSKILRFQTMDLTRMHDIAGARCILTNEKKVIAFVEEIKKSKILTIKDVDDYISNPKETGYKSIHLRCLCEDKYIEIQVRDDTQHSWATLVEITDVIYKTKIKENSDDKGTGLYTFLQLFSKSKNLTSDERAKMNEVLLKTKFIQKLTNTFSKNATTLRNNWCKKESKEGQFYIFEVNKKNNPNITIFKDFVTAEEQYFSTFTKDILVKEKNLVMAYISDDDFELISKAYSNYVLIKHNFYLKLASILNNDSHDTKVNKQSLKLLKLCILNNYLVHIAELNILINTRNNYNKKYADWKKSLTQEIKAIPLSLKKNQNINILDITYIKVRVKLFFMETKLNHYLKREKRKMK